MRKQLCAIGTFIGVLFAVAGCGSLNQSGDKSGKSLSAYVVEDITGRRVEFDKVPESVVVLGHGGLKFYAYVCGDEKLIGVEDMEKQGRTLKSQGFHHAYPHIRKVDTVGMGGPKISPDYEQISYKKPDVIFRAYADKDELDKMQQRLKIPVVGIGAGKNGEIFGEDTYKTIGIVGKVMGKEQRSEELVQFIKETEKDLRKRAGNIVSGPKTYMGGCAFRGEQGILSTKGKADLLDVIKGNNVMAGQTKERSVIIDKEKLLELDPEMIIVDLSGKAKILGERQEDPEFFQSLRAVKNENMYAIMPYFTYGMNYDTALLDMYYIGQLTHPEAFQDVDINSKAKEIYTLFNGTDVYGQLLKAYPQSFKRF